MAAAKVVRNAKTLAKALTTYLANDETWALYAKDQPRPTGAQFDALIKDFSARLQAAHKADKRDFSFFELALKQNGELTGNFLNPDTYGQRITETLQAALASVVPAETIAVAPIPQEPVAETLAKADVVVTNDATDTPLALTVPLDELANALGGTVSIDSDGKLTLPPKLYSYEFALAVPPNEVSARLGGTLIASNVGTTFVPDGQSRSTQQSTIPHDALARTLAGQSRERLAMDVAADELIAGLGRTSAVQDIPALSLQELAELPIHQLAERLLAGSHMAMNNMGMAKVFEAAILAQSAAKMKLLLDNPKANVSPSQRSSDDNMDVRRTLLHVALLQKYMADRNLTAERVADARIQITRALDGAKERLSALVLDQGVSLVDGTFAEQARLDALRDPYSDAEQTRAAADEQARLDALRDPYSDGEQKNANGQTLADLARLASETNLDGTHNVTHIAAADSATVPPQTAAVPATNNGTTAATTTTNDGADTQIDAGAQTDMSGPINIFPAMSDELKHHIHGVIGQPRRLTFEVVRMLAAFYPSMHTSFQDYQRQMESEAQAAPNHRLAPERARQILHDNIPMLRPFRTVQYDIQRHSLTFETHEGHRLNDNGYGVQLTPNQRGYDHNTALLQSEMYFRGHAVDSSVTDPAKRTLKITLESGLNTAANNVEMNMVAATILRAYQTRMIPVIELDRGGGTMVKVSREPTPDGQAIGSIDIAAYLLDPANRDKLAGFENYLRTTMRGLTLEDLVAYYRNPSLEAAPRVTPVMRVTDTPRPQTPAATPPAATPQVNGQGNGEVVASAAPQAPEVASPIIKSRAEDAGLEALERELSLPADTPSAPTITAADPAERPVVSDLHRIRDRAAEIEAARRNPTPMRDLPKRPVVNPSEVAMQAIQDALNLKPDPATSAPIAPRTNGQTATNGGEAGSWLNQFHRSQDARRARLDGGDALNAEDRPFHPATAAQGSANGTAPAQPQDRLEPAAILMDASQPNDTSLSPRADLGERALRGLAAELNVDPAGVVPAGAQSQPRLAETLDRLKDALRRAGEQRQTQAGDGELAGDHMTARPVRLAGDAPLPLPPTPPRT